MSCFRGIFPLSFAWQLEIYSGTGIEKAKMRNGGRFRRIEVVRSTYLAVGPETAQREMVGLGRFLPVRKPCVLTDGHLKHCHPVVRT